MYCSMPASGGGGSIALWSGLGFSGLGDQESQPDSAPELYVLFCANHVPSPGSVFPSVNRGSNLDPLILYSPHWPPETPTPCLLLTPWPHRPTYQWFRDGSPLADGQSNHTVSSKERNLTLRPASPEHSGTYSCCAHNAFGQACSSQNFTLSIAGEPGAGMEQGRRGDERGHPTLPAHVSVLPSPQMRALPG